MSDTDALSVTVVRQLSKEGTGWTITLAKGRLTVTGGTHADAYSPVDIEVWAMEQLITDMRSLQKVGKRDG